MRGIMLALAVSTLSFSPALGDEELAGTYKLVGSTRKIVETGEVQESYGKQPQGYIMYGRDGRMLFA